MPNVIDSLVVLLGLDSKDLDAKAPAAGKKLNDLQKSATGTEKGVQGIGKASKDTAGELSVLTGKMSSFLAVIGGTVAIRAFVRDTIEANTQLHFLSQNLNMTVNSLFSLGAAGQQIGIGRGALQGLAAMFRQIPGQLAAGNQPPIIKLLARAGINWTGDPAQMMQGLAQWFGTMPANVALGLGTSSGLSYDQMTFLLQGAQRVASELKASGGFAPTSRETAQAAALKQQITLLGLQFSKIGYDLLSMVTPALEKFLSVLQSIGAWGQRHEAVVGIIAGLITGLGAIAGIGTALSLAAGAFGALMAAMPSLAVVGIVAALAASILLLWQDYEVWGKGGKSAFDWTGWVNTINAAKGAWDDLGESIHTALNWLDKWAVKIFGSQQNQAALEDKAIAAYNAAHPGNQLYLPKGDTRRTAHLIAQNEGFYATDRHGNQVGNIPQKAHNPGDIEYGDFARRHGATGYVLAKGGKKIATFADDNAGWNAAYALLESSGYSSLSPAQQMKKWVHGIKGSSSVASAAGAYHSSVSNSTDNSKTVHIGTVNMQPPAGASPSTPGMARGMDWTTLLTQSNVGVW